jgi:transcription antitermination factor NusG
MTEGSWIVAAFAPRSHGRILDWLDEAGVDVFLPLVRRRARIRRRHVDILAPLFPNYLFARLKDSTALYRSPGIIRVLDNGQGTPAILPATEVDFIRSRCNSKGIYTGRRFSPGDPISVIAGWLSGFTGIYAGDDHILVEAFGRQTDVRIDEALLTGVTAG